MASIICRSLFVFSLMILRVYSIEAIVTELNELKGMAGPSSKSDSNQVFIVYLGGVSLTTTNARTSVHLDMLSGVLGSTQAAQESLLYSYTNSFNGFAAMFSETQAWGFGDLDDVVYVFKSEMKRLHTTASWEYLGLSTAQGLWPQSDFGSNIIVGLIDTGVWPESESFRDEGLGPSPSRWKGTCVSGDQFGPENCNRKLIGARFYYKGYEAVNPPIERPEYKSPRDAAGHGTHTSSTVAGRQDVGASFVGLANGTASGGASLGRVAMYKACWYDKCNEADILAAFDDAITDGVDILSVSLGATDKGYISAIALGSFHAVDRGIVVSCSAGNDGPLQGQVGNVAPWIFTVGANMLNRNFVSTVQLGNGMSYEGQGINTYEMNSSYPLVYAGDIPSLNATSIISSDCAPGSLDGAKVKGKIILCYFGDYYYGHADETVLTLGGVGVIIIADPSMYTYTNPSIFSTVIPLSIVNPEQGSAILQYVNSSSSPRALIQKAITTFNSSAPPVMAYFSSLGPNAVTADISKPDITAPGVDIIAAWPPIVNPSREVGDNRSVNFNIISGTSMSCPHVAGATALVKSVHPDWSPASIKSALMTTATPLRPSINPLTGADANSGLATGSGQINPARASDPGLVYNTSTTDYLLFLCSIGYSSTELTLISGSPQTCPANTPTVLDLNYPSIFLRFYSNSSIAETVMRTLTNVENQAAQYNVTVVAPTGVNVTVVPSSLSFTAFNDERSYTVSISVPGPVNIVGYVFGSIVWSDGQQHSVRIPIGVGPSATFV